VGRELTGSGRVLTGTGERTWVECDSTVNGLPSVNDTGSEQCSRGMWAGLGGLTEEVRKVRLTLAFLPLISIIVSIRRNTHYITCNLIIVSA
jgi:hypothetical protein